MIPSILAWQLQNGMGDFVDTSFPMANDPFKGSLRKMADTKGALFHDPYVSVRLPFRKAEEASFSFVGLQMDKTPYVHQQKAFERLTGDDGRSTVIATGTGSGKTECFLYPILDYCFRHRGDAARGIKAIIVYPMNALASDQARRIACIIHKNPKLNGAVTCGMYVGGKNNGGAVRMTETEVISDHETLLKYPPDILLTNYKMLDYLLVRPKDSALWRNNDPYTLKYIAVDELHTFDGAQGTDLACLIRRLKKRLDIGKGYLCCVGTSATMGSGDDAGNIRNYAEEIFGERFEESAVITEDRLSSDEFFVGEKALYADIPSDETVSGLDALVSENDVEGYLDLAARSWFPGLEYGDIGSDEARIDLGLKLMRHETFRKLMFFAEGKYVQSRAVAKELPELGEGKIADSRICSLYALISHARAGTPGSTMPFLNVQVQFWMKELRRLVGKVDAARVTYALSPYLTTEQRKRFLPVVNCRECGMTGWATLRDLHETSLELPSVEEFYNKYFDPSSSSQILMAFPSGQGEEGVDTQKYELCPNCLHFSYKNDRATGRCSVCGAETMTVDIPELQKTSANARGQFVCPYCGSRRGLTILGLRSTREISAALSQIFASRYNDDKKVLAFSDSVQDAAHKAGFFNSRTWKYSLHSSLQHYCDAGGGDGKSLDDFQDGYIEYLHKEYSDADIVGYFTAPNMTWRYSYEDTVKSGRWEGRAQDKKFMEDLESRLKYEILLEYGLSGNFGKTLEKTGCSVLSFRREDVADLAQMTREVAVNEYGLTEEPIETFYNICIGVLTQLKSSGAFADDVFDKFLARNCETFMLDEHINRWLPKRQTGRNTPRFYAKHLSYDRKMTDQLDSKDSSRYRNWIRDCVRNSPMKLDPESCGEICDFVIGAASDAGILQSVSVGETREVFGINKQSVFVTGKVRQMRCDKCGISFAVSESDVEFWKGAPCRRRVCRGTLHADEDTGADYFGRLYKDGDFYKINAKEHTGLLEKDVREKTETDFKRHTGRSAWDPNVLSCTPTLEMGIDVGDLSTVVLCSVPPVQSQFTQRSGRAGRTDGNALTIAVANAVSHDLYFYEDPLDMIEGRVEPPRIFLEASAVLERQLTAFCMDTWVKRYGGADLIPASVGQILGAMESGEEKLFPYNFIKYVQGNKHTLFIQFADILGIESDHTCFDELRAFIGETRSEKLSIDLKIVDAFQVLRKQVESLQSDIGELKNRVGELKRGVQDSSIDSDIRRAENEVKALAAVIGQIKKKNVFNFLSDEGILPNYAFPEAGVILRAVLFRKNSDDDDDATGYRTVPYEYSRSAASAISEFAPGNTFYVDGKKLVVDQIDLKTSSLEKWRLCPNCSYAELETSVNTKVCCPRCGSPGWRDVGQVKYMIKAQTVYSNMSYRETLIDDSSDNRISSFYNEQLLVDVDTENDIEKAYRIKSDEYDFGYEFDKKAIIRDINFGSKDSVGEKTTVAGNTSVRKGFTICGECGKVQTRGSEPSHSFKCSHYHKETSGADPYVDCLFIYREFETETMRLLVPFAAGDSHVEGTHSFAAAFMLGMNEYFGNVEHLRTTITNYPDSDLGMSKQYLTIYDSVPGGTGYLKQLLTDENSLVTIFQKALDKLKNCTCKDDPEKDGCYHCIYRFGINRDIGGISRKKAIEILEGILAAKDSIEAVKNLDVIPTNHIGDSVLESEFLAAVKKEVGDGNFSVKDVNGKVGYAVKFGGNEWEIEPQVNLGPADGVSVVSKPDFVLWPKSGSGALPVTIFTDGFVYHENISDIDTLKREAIRRSGRFRVWSLSYEDVEGYVNQWREDWYTETMDYKEMPGGAVYENTAERQGGGAVSPCERTSLKLLFDYLRLDDAEKVFKGQAVAYSYSLLDANLLGNLGAFDVWLETMKSVALKTGFTTEDFNLATCLFGEWTPKLGKDFVRVYAGTDRTKRPSERTIAVCAVLNDIVESKLQEYKRDWNGFLKLCNVMQFSDAFIGVSEKGLETYTYANFKTP